VLIYKVICAAVFLATRVDPMSASAFNQSRRPVVLIVMRRWRYWERLSARRLPDPMSEIALFPLSSVLLPTGRMSLQIFEQRYLDLVARCMREDEGFGVVWLQQGSEVSGGSVDTPNVGDYGVYARIVDWDQLPNGLLGILIEGQQRFDVQSVWREADGLVKAKVAFTQTPATEPLPEGYAALAEVLEGLLRHPQIQRLKLQSDLTEAWSVGSLLAQLLPIDEAIKYELQGITSVEHLLAEMDNILVELSGEERA
jgi:Lon protease-like protein